MAQAPTQDFIVNSGLTVLGTATVTSSTGNTSTLQVDGGAAIAKNLIVGEGAVIYGDLEVYGIVPFITVTTGTFTNLTVTGLSTLNAVTAGITTASQLDVASRLLVGGLSELNNATLSNQTNSTSSTTGALQVSGGVGIQKDLWVGGQAYVNGYQVLTTATIIASTLQAVTEQGSSTTVAISVLNTTSSTSTDSGALTVVGGVGIGGALYVGTASYINNSLILTTATVDLYATKTSILAGTDTAVNTSTGIVTVWNTSTLQSVTDRGVTTTNVIVITNTQSSTSTVAGNALQVSGGVGIDGSLYVNGAAYFQNNVIFAGTSTYVYSTNTVYTDNLINMHVPVGSTGTNHDWAVDDGKDIGLVYHYYKGQDHNAFLGLANNTGYLEWYSQGNEVGGTFTGTEYGVFKTGAIVLTSSTVSVSTTTGALVVGGGVGIGKNLFVGTSATISTNSGGPGTGLRINKVDLFAFSGSGNNAGEPTFRTSISSATTVFRVMPNNTATNGIGAQFEFFASDYFTTPSGWHNFRIVASTSSFIIDTAKDLVGDQPRPIIFNLGGQGVATNTATVPNVLTLTTSGVGINTLTPGAQFGVEGTVRIAGITTITTTTNSISTTTGALQVVGGVGIGKDLYVGGTIYGTLVGGGSISTATNLSAGTAGQLVYQTAPGVTSYYGPGTAGQILLSNGTSGPVYTNTASIYVGRAVLADNASTATTATNLTAGTAGQVPYQTAPGATSFFGPGTAGNVLVSNGASAPTYNNTLTLVGTTTSISTTTGALQVRGGVGIGGSVYVGNRVGFVGTNSASAVYQVYNAATNSLDTVFG